MTTAYEQLDGWIDKHFDEQVRFLQELVRVPTDTPPGNNRTPSAPPSCSKPLATRQKSMWCPPPRYRPADCRPSPT